MSRDTYVWHHKTVDLILRRSNGHDVLAPYFSLNTLSFLLYKLFFEILIDRTRKHTISFESL